jgi:type IV pilus assembly protein PilP
MKRMLITCAVLALGGCAQDKQDLHDYLAQVKARAPTPIDPIPQIKQAETFLYVADNRRSPFIPSTVSEMVTAAASSGDGPRPDPNRRREELEGYPLDTLRMVGTLKKQSNYWGLVQTRDRMIHRVERGNYLGENYGRILDIDEDRVSLRELIQDGAGGYLERQASLALGERE